MNMQIKPNPGAFFAMLMVTLGRPVRGVLFFSPIAAVKKDAIEPKRTIGSTSGNIFFSDKPVLNPRQN
ncbi:hypothetical protein KSS92_09925 [Pseudomonas atacamensis]|uniref:hypothetical protein n=1 Tax=Pseudomonas atacamensis TaxID=2565368 RepID=UPI001C3DE6B8|nr:hypothetical protein [Pseudomonas atacamensis]QXH74801.1 hypothetical protein KSS92_09925 [Pseudomonas atacamensis]